MNARVRLADLLAGIADPAAAGAIEITGLTLDSRRVRAGDAFVALRGTRQHGVAFAPAALAQGAAAVLAEAPAPAAPVHATAEGRANHLPPLAWDDARRAEGGREAEAQAPILWIDRLRDHLGEIAARYYARPSAALHVIGVTGTNGKTSTVQLLAAALAGLGHGAATIGTLGAGMYGHLEAGERTTPDVISVHGLLAGFRDAGASYVAMEVSSHALDQGRVDAIDFDVAVFTNLTRDHLDYHGTMEAYGAAKARLFAWPGLRAAVINVDDAFGRRLAAALPAGVRCLRYSAEGGEAELAAERVRTHADGIDFLLRTPWGAGEVRSRLLGRFNVSNLLAVAGCLGALGMRFDAVCEALAALAPVDGRMNRLGGGTAPLVVVDYAHTPDALEQALATLRAHCEGRLVCVFGCGGDRDPGKRPQMGAIAERLADRAIVTDDNPRSEDGDAIVAQILAGFARPERARVERDRAAAIARAVREAQPGDVVLIAGKGHETYQEVAGSKRPFDDLAEAKRALEARPC
ncbi:UDP-N-acetylmuramyl-tripeptide synthetase [Mizugakiibacter sediminis]|uniref:UDP-N-acetylmuramoyl-L-alanyl-D-glutamate--2,6-diaminopimelate ligase n=2 Tax=Mizugakiibacter sediminis TaxID=1475481 RepID=A0A0K8QQK0_9GAMM|nr:UDP-N-acetylmuramoyl-L-alanyl-D-glutamate--2,6-diaminopimelate ligase [Mizugakiibacter sediminis]GAP67164.1 UDP-N-acetylmuramyl-tripeptide synthetase [Mizugakiibacter sediminis]